MMISSTLDNNFEIKYGSEFGTWEYNKLMRCWRVELTDELVKSLLRSDKNLVMDCQYGHMTLVRADNDPYAGDHIVLAEGQYSLINSISSMELSTTTEEVESTPAIDHIEGDAILKVTSTPNHKRKIYNSKNILGDDIKIQVTKTTFKDPKVKVIFGGNYNIELDDPNIFVKLSKGLKIENIKFKKYLCVCFPETFSINSAKFYILDKDELMISGVDASSKSVTVNIINDSNADSDFNIKNGDNLLYRCHIESNGRVILNVGKGNTRVTSDLKIDDIKIPISISIDEYDKTSSDSSDTGPKSSIALIADDGTIQYLTSECRNS